MNWGKHHSLLIFIFFLAFFLRLDHLAAFPVGFHGDEASIGYNAYSLLRTGRDQNGVFLPIAIDQFGDFRPAGYHYLAIPSVALFGLNEMATRLPAALFGSLTIIALFFLLKSLFDEEKIALIGASLLAISPWHIIVSRATSEGVIALFFIVGGAFFFLEGVKRNRRFLLYLALAFSFFIISFFFYHAARFFVPLLIIFLSFFSLFNFKMKRKKKKYLLFLNLLLFVGLGLIFFSSRGMNRSFDISIFNDQKTLLVLAEQIREDGGQNIYFTRLLHNKVVAYAHTFLENYFQHFTGDFLFLKGGLPMRYWVPFSGLLYPLEVVFLILGFSFLLVNFFKEKKRLFVIPLVWLILGPLPAAFTFEDIPNIQRSVMMLPALIIIIAYGLKKTLNLISLRLGRIIIGGLIFLIYLYSLIFFSHNYFHHSLTHQPWYRNAGEKELVETLGHLAEKGNEIITTAHGDNNIIFYLFFLQIEPADYQKLGSPRDDDGLLFGKITLINTDCPLKPRSLIGGDLRTEEEMTTIYVNKGECPIPKDAEIIKIVERPDRTPAFQILKVNPSWTPAD